MNIDQEIISKTAEYVKSKLIGEWSWHDWWHVYRVWQMSKTISSNEVDVDIFIVELAALLHDIADWKFHNWDDSIWPRIAKEWLEKLNVWEDKIIHICRIIKDASFKWAWDNSTMSSIEWMIVQDADRLDAIWAIWIWRTFAYWGSKWREMYNPDTKPEKHNTFEEYKLNQSNTINHFYEKLLLLKWKMNTKTAKTIAENRHNVMEAFLEEFLKEWNWIS
jgi:uncharacterized protein